MVYVCVCGASVQWRPRGVAASVGFVRWLQTYGPGRRLANVAAAVARFSARTEEGRCEFVVCCACVGSGWDGWVGRASLPRHVHASPEIDLA